MAKKMWGQREFWGLGYDCDPQWFLTDAQKELQVRLIELCRTTLRPNAIISDRTYEFPRKNLNAMAELGLLGLLVPKELGGLGENHQCAAMVCETIARYGCPSTALVYVMHLCATADVLMRHHDNDHMKDLMRRLDKEKLVGTVSFSDAATGGHFWYLPSNKCWRLPDGSYKILKHSSWTTASGFADWYQIQVASPDSHGDYSNTTNFVFYKDEMRGNTEDWSALGMRGNQSGPSVFEATVKPERRFGPEGDGITCNIECTTFFFSICTSAVWNGIAMGSIDLAKRHVVSKTHGDVGLRVCDYVTIQDYFGQQISEMNASRAMVSSLCQALDGATNNNDWSIYADVSAKRREPYSLWNMQTELVSSSTASRVVDVMMQACGGDGYKTELGLERLLRDAKAGWVLSPSNEVLRTSIGKAALLGPNSLDMWCKVADERVLRGELRKLSDEEKLQLADRLVHEANLDKGSRDDSFDFDNPLSTRPPSTVGKTVAKGVKHAPALRPDKLTEVKLVKVEVLTRDEKYAMLTFEYPDVNMHSGCLTGQYIQLCLPKTDTGRYISPTSEAGRYGNMEMVVRYETQGVMASFLQQLKIGDGVRLRGPCGGLEYHPNTYDQIVFLCGGIGITPAIQMVRAIRNDPSDKTRISLFFQAKNSDELLFREELDEAASDERVEAVYTLQDPDDAWPGDIGYLSHDFLQERMPPARFDGRQKVVISGGGQMITAVLNSLMLLRYRSQDIFVYGPFAAEQIRGAYGRKAALFSQ